MIPLATLIRQFEGRLLQKYQHVLLPGHKRALAAMSWCRSQTGPQMQARCSAQHCHEQITLPHSCGHRSCPHCQNHENWQWIENQLDKRLPTRYYLITFTLPRQLRKLAWSHQRLVYGLMFACVQETLKSFVRNDKQLGGVAGLTCVLHTHARNLDFHPHIHVVMPGASIDPQSGLWRKKSSRYLFNHKNLAGVFRAKLLESMVNHDQRIPATTPKDWVVDCKHVGDGSKTFIYLGKYLYKGVIQEKDILSCDNGQVTFRYLHAKSKTYRTRILPGEDFLYLLLRHVLPRGFQRARCYGFLHPCSKKLIKFLQLVLRVSPVTMVHEKKTRPEILCPVCGAPMVIVKTGMRKPLISVAAEAT